jgi:predicted adenine nucleotide alpha hydrolase (AANH) superfamily ATPase
MKCLMHICCAPCSIYPVGELLKNNADKITGFYFNPNIYPDEEYSRRRAAVEEYWGKKGLEVIYPDYEPSRFSRSVANNESQPARCRICWQMRLEETAALAKTNGFDSFSTTLLISPYQEHLTIKSIGESVARRAGLEFYYEDFRSGFRYSQEEARRNHLYMQKYCGCRFSLVEAQEHAARVRE